MKARSGLLLFLFLLVLFVAGAGLSAAQGNGQAAVPPDPAAAPVGAACTLDVFIRGGGSVRVTRPDGAEELLVYGENAVTYGCDSLPQLTAIPQARWRFVGWQGDLSGDRPIQALTKAADGQVTAVFAMQGLIYTSDFEPYERYGRLITETAVLNPNWGDAFTAPPPDLNSADAAAPEITIWYGATQDFGQVGLPQKWINIFGEVSDADGDLTALTYTLNGGAPNNLALGADGRRLYFAGDFNVEIDKNALLNGLNQVIITAQDALGNQDQQLVSVNYDGENIWPLPYTVNWSAVTDLSAVSQVVDGEWYVDLLAGGVRTSVMAYDRIIAMGDVTWRNYEVTVPITVHNTDPAAYNPISIAPGLGLVLRWQGHTNTPVVCPQPHCGWLPQGNTAWYDFGAQGGTGQFTMSGNVKDQSGRKLQLDTTYYWKVRAETLENDAPRYRFKIWQAGTAEPDSWLLTSSGEPGANHLAAGSLLLVAHHVDATFGDVTITSLDAVEDTTPPVISDIQVTPGVDSATFTWKTDEPATSRVQVAFGGEASSSALVLQHSLVVTGLTPDTLYDYRITSVDAAGNSATTALQSFRTLPTREVVSDDFNACALNTALWEFVNPLGTGAYWLDGERLYLSVPAGTEHDIWPSANPALPTIRVPRVMQTVTTVSDIQMKFDSGVSEVIQVQGVLIEQDDQNLFRVNFQRQGSETRIFVISILNNTPTILLQDTFVGASPFGPLYLRVARSGNNWTVFYSKDGFDWISKGPYAVPLLPTKVGPFVGNSATTPGAEPAHTAAIDYFFNSASPISPEDAQANILPVSIVGNGRVDKNPDCGNPVTLTAVPAAGWEFANWSGAPIDGATDATIVAAFAKGDAVTANFTTDQPQYTVDLNIVNNGEGVGGVVTRDPDYATYLAGDRITFTATPKPHWRFTGWGGALGGTNPVNTLVVSGNATVTATFTQDRYTLNVTAVGNGTVQKTPDKVDYAYGDRVTLTAVPDPGYAFAGWSGGLLGNPVEIVITENTAVTATFIPASGNPRSDDFNSCTLDSRWTFINPLGDGALRMTGMQAVLTAPAGANHSLWQGLNPGDPPVRTAPRIMTVADNLDFDVVAKFESAPTERYQFQGILVEEDNDSFLRIEFLHDGQQLSVFAASILDNVALIRGNRAIDPGDNLYLRVTRQGNVWTVTYSYDGDAWNAGLTFNVPLRVSSVGVYVGNEGFSGNPAPAFSAVVDYFFNMDAPIVPEDGRKNRINVTITGEGRVQRQPSSDNYQCGAEVRLTALPDPGWEFVGWSGDLSGTANPMTLTITGAHNVGATFTQSPVTETKVFLPIVRRR